MKKVLRPTFSCNLKETIGNQTVVAFNVGPSGEVYVLLAVDTLDYRTEDNGFASFAKIIPDSPQRYRVLIIRKGELELDLVVSGERFNIHEIQPLGSNLLLTCSRSQYRGEHDFDLNARVYSRDGVFLREFLLGDGIASIQTTRRGEIWTSYFDEGVFGNYGWHTPVGATGLVAWNEMGDKVYEYDAVGPVDAIVDCYALNVASDEDVWCYYYTDFPLVHLREKRIVATWTVPVSGSPAFCVANEHVLFAGGYKQDDAFQLVRLASNGMSKLIGEFNLIGDDGTPVKPVRIIGRGAKLYVLGARMLYEIELKQIIATRQGR